MFGLVCSGRPVAIAQQVENLKFVFNVENGSNISHVSLFILPDTPFDPNYSALIYFQLPSADPGSNTFKLLGKLSVEKPSAIFRIKNAAPGLAVGGSQAAANSVGQIDDDIMLDDESDAVKNNPALGAQTASAAAGPLVIGISIEPNTQAEQLLAEAKLAQQQERAKMLTQTPYVTSASPALTAVPTPGEIAARDPAGVAMLANKVVSNAYNYLSGFVDDNNKVSMKVLDGWWNKFKIKLQNDPKFLDQ